MGVPLGVFLGRFGFHLAFPHAVGIAFQESDIGMMGEAVEQRGDAGGVGEDGIPFLEGFVGSQDHGIAFVAVVDDFEQQVGGVGVIGQVTDFVKHEQAGAGVETELAATPGGGIPVQVGEQVGDGAEQGGVAGQDGSVGDIFGNQGFAQAGRAAQDQVAAAGEEVEGEGAFDQGAVDFLGPAPLEIRDRFEAAQPGLRETAFQAAAGGGFRFGTSDFFQQLAGAPAPGGGAGYQV